MADDNPPTPPSYGVSVEDDQDDSVSSLPDSTRLGLICDLLTNILEVGMETRDATCELLEVTKDHIKEVEQERKQMMDKLMGSFPTNLTGHPLPGMPGTPAGMRVQIPFMPKIPSNFPLPFPAMSPAVEEKLSDPDDSDEDRYPPGCCDDEGEVKDTENEITNSENGC